MIEGRFAARRFGVRDRGIVRLERASHVEEGTYCHEVLTVRTSGCGSPLVLKCVSCADKFIGNAGLSSGLDSENV